jgi:50S ribosomal protein L16 3-hydroxylase
MTVDVHMPLPLLGGMTPTAFMRRYWQRRPLLVRQAWPGVKPPLSRAALFALAAQADVESRFVQHAGDAWTVRSGPLARRRLPPVGRAGWTLLVQGLDLHVSAAHEMLARFSFLPAARLDDLMTSWASEDGGVGPHADSYDVFLLQVQGRRRWRVAAPGPNAFVEGLPLKILQHFEPQHDWLLEPGDMLYLPPRWGHDGVAEGGECMTCSVGFRAPSAPELARELLSRIADDVGGASAEAGVAAREAPIYSDATQAATPCPGAVPPALVAFASRAVSAALRDPKMLPRVLGEYLSEPKTQVWFEAGARADEDAPMMQLRPLRLDARTRMLYDARHVFVNGESYRAAGADARVLRALADRRSLPAREVGRLSAGAKACVQEWLAAGWLHAGDG